MGLQGGNNLEQTQSSSIRPRFIKGADRKGALNTSPAKGSPYDFSDDAIKLAGRRY